ncbi:hypothetical protein [Streptomyces sp. NPDC048845]|uniref:hypothetical protein n=1 Tax=Streptomyces sp. NPDC048845 TaxID=3155390 RepID=UPI0034264F8E
MTSTVLCLTVAGEVTATVLPQTADEQWQLVREKIGGPADQGRYHRSALLHIHGTGARDQLDVNLSAWALASAWAGQDLPYWLYGDIVLTGPQYSDGSLAPLGTVCAGQVREAAEAVREVLLEWKGRAPASESAARSEILAAVRHRLAVQRPHA